MSISFVAKDIIAKSLKSTESDSSSRFPFLDRTRGLIMVFMALDHALFFGVVDVLIMKDYLF